ncbi:amino acid adenylation domain-containing protein [Streptomyces sp. NPDC090022]|uniref:amino acid adenylation domain-containing protein n=1 Tax=Streptomyces sp. NPDC090022 TaxID=3365920 RepID=UPI0038093156
MSNVPEQLRGNFPGISVDYPKDRTVLQLFEDRAAARPDAPAVTHGATTLTYGQLDRRANTLAARLLELGTERGEFVPLAVQGGLELPLTMIAAMKIGAPFVPIDDAGPADRVRAMLDTLDARLAVRSAEAPDLPGYRVLRVDPTALPETAQAPDRAPAGLADPVYGFYTSGSTGLPKCTVNIHGGLLNRFQYMSAALSDRADEVVLQNSRHQFDSSLWQLLWPLTTGSRVVIPERSGILDLTATIEVIERHGVTTTDFVPSIFNTLVELLRTRPELVASLRSLRRLLIGGEEMTADAVHSFRALLPHVTIVNTYGPTEASIGSVFHIVTDEDRDPIPIGRPIHNTYAVIVDERMRPVEVGETGEICIGGTCLGLGYLGDRAKTDAAFVPNPFPQIPGERLYRTGDLGHHRPDGLLQFAGRRDHQVKIGGIRVELSEVEAGLLRHPSVREAKVIAHGPTAARTLLAYVTLRAPLTPAELRDHARSVLPAALVPRRFTVLDAMPLTPNGKADRKALARLAEGASGAVPPPAPATLPGPGTGTAFGQDTPGAQTPDADRATPAHPAPAAPPAPVPPPTAAHALGLVHAAWLGILPVPYAAPDDDFFDLGGDSLAAQRLAVALSARTGVRVSVREVFEHPTLAGQAGLLTGSPATAPAPAPAVPTQEFRTARTAPTETRDTAPDQPDDRLPADITAAAPPAGPDLRHVLLTGATGFIGAQLLHDLLAGTDATVHCLVRAADAGTAFARVIDNLRAYRLWDPARAHRIKAVPGDLAQPLLGLTPARFGELARELDAVLHNGATVNLARGYRAHHAANVAGTVEILRLATTHRLKDVHFISTLGVLAATAATGEEGPVPAAPVPADGYSRSKWVAERLLEQAADRGVHVTIHRFGEVMPHSRTGVPSRTGLFDLLVKACVRTGQWFASPIATDYTPVDTVSALVVAALTRRARGWFHGIQPRGVTLDELMAVFQEEFGLRQVDYAAFWEAVQEAAATDTAPEDLVRVLAVLPAPDPQDETRVKEALAGLFRLDPATVARARTERLAEIAGIPWPEPGPELFRGGTTHYRALALGGEARR